MGLAAERQDRQRFSAARSYSLEIEGRLLSDDMARKNHEELEEFASEAGREWARRMLQEHLDLRAEVERRVHVEGSDGVERGSIRQSIRQLKTIVGDLDVSRLAYQAAGAAGLHPMDAPLLASAAMDRLLHHSHVLRLLGDTYRNPKKTDPKKTNKKETSKS